MTNMDTLTKGLYMKNKLLSIGLALGLLAVCASTATAEARTCFSLNLGGFFAPPVTERYVVEHYSPYYVAPPPVYVYPETCAPTYYIAPRPVCRPVYRQVYIAPQPRPCVPYGGASFHWNSR